MTSPHRQVILDTDIGSDVDDALALAMLLGSPEVTVLGCTTVYGDTLLRARIAAAIVRLTGHEPTEIPCVPGESDPLSGREIWWAGHEGLRYRSLPTEVVDESLPAHEWLAWMAATSPGEIDVIAIGPLTNIALALRADPQFAHNVRRVWIMGGRYDGGAVDGDAADGDAADSEVGEHNFASDAVAAAEVLASPTPLTLVGLDLTRQVVLPAARVGELGGAGELGRLLEQETRDWMRRWNESHDVPHDATTALALIRPELFVSVPAQVAVDSETGVCRVQWPSPETPCHQEVLTSVMSATALQEILLRIAASENGTDDATGAIAGDSDAPGRLHRPETTGA